MKLLYQIFYHCLSAVNQSTLMPKKNRLFNWCKIGIKPLLILTFMLWTTVSVAQNLATTYVSLDLKESNLRNALKQIETKTKYIFSYKSQDIEVVKGITLKADKISVEETLSRILKNTGFNYQQINNNIVVKKENQSVSDILGIPAPKTTRMLTGKVVNSENNEVIPGVTITCADLGTMYSTDKLGIFTMPYSAECKVMEVSCVGFHKKTVTLNNEIHFLITLEPRSTSLSEVIVTGYTSVDRRLSASAISTIKGEDLERKDFMSVDQMLQGKVSGLNVNIISTTPGAAPKIRLRGTSTLLGSREPIWVVDGFVIDAPVKISAQDINSLDNVNLLTSPVAGLNPNDIDRIDVLKDASATALYGVNGANGVIVITTKGGRFNQKLAVNYSSSFILNTAPRYNNLPIMNSKQRAEVSREITTRGLNYSVGQPRVGYEGAYQDYKDGLITFQEFNNRAKYFETLNTDWFDILFRPGFSQSHNINFSAGSSNTNYFASLGASNQNSSALFNGQKRYSGMFKFNSQLSKNLSIGLKMSGALNSTETPFSNDLYNYAYRTSRAMEFERNGERVYYTNDVVSGGNSPENIAAGYNIMTELEGSRKMNDMRAMDVATNLEWKFLKNFRFTGNYGYVTTQTKGNSYATEETFYVADTYRNTIKLGVDIPLSLKPNVVTPRGGEYRESNAIRNAYTVRNAIDYSNTIGNHFFSGLIGNEFRNTEYNVTNSFRLGYLPDRGLIFYVPNMDDYPLYYQRYSTGNSYANLTLGNSVNRFASWYGIFTYSFKKRYTFNVNVRNDGSNRFGTDINKKFLPTFSSAFRWVASDEPWFDKSKNLNLLAFRLSYGFNGNVPESESPKLIISQPFINNVTGDDISTVNTYPNPFLRWEKTSTINSGLELALFNNRITAGVDVYYKKGVDLISRIEVPAINGVNTVALNGAGIENKGYEVSMNFVPVKSNDWNWNIGFLFGRNYSKISKSIFEESRPGVVNPGRSFYFGINSYLYGNVLREGIDPNTLYAYKFQGLNASGIPTFKGIYTSEYTGAPTVTDYYNNILTPIGSRIPKFDGSVNTGLKYKNWRLNASFIVKLGYYQRLPDLYNTNSNIIPSTNENFSSEFLNRWRKPGDEAFTNIPVLTDDRLSLTSSSVPYTISSSIWQVYNFSDLRVVNASHVRLSSLGLNYNLKLNSKGKSLIQNASIRFQANDIFVIADKKWQGRDPETTPSSLGRLPSYIFSLSIGF